MSFEEFAEYYKQHGMCKGDAFRRKNKYTQKQLKTRYEKYMRKHNDEGLSKDQELREAVLRRDRGCRLFDAMTWQEKIDVAREGIDTAGTDVAHIFNKSTYPHMRYDIDNVVLLCRTFHNRLDAYKHPITGKRISKADTERFWMRIVGIKMYNELKMKAKEGKICE